MMATLAQLYKKAKAAGHSASEIRGKSAAEIQELLSNGGGSKSTATKKVVVKKAVSAKGKATKKRGRGRPKGSKNTTTAKATATPAKKRGRGRPKGSTNSKSTTTKRSTSNSSDGRHLLSKVNYSKTEGWNPRDGSPPDRIVKALKKFRGDREKVFNFLKGDIWDFMGKTMRDGSKRTKADAESMLRYRIARTDWQFALQTGQHEIATDRAEYGTAGTGEGTFKRGKAAPAKKSGGKRGRPAKKSAGRAKSASKATPARSTFDVKGASKQALSKYVKSFEGKRGRRPAEYAPAVRRLAKLSK
jgi:hypothetical protein